MKKEDYIRSVDKVTFEQYKLMAQNGELSNHEKIGFPDEYRENFTEKIFEDICSKLEPLKQSNKRIADIGCGCDILARMIMRFSTEHGHELFMIDSNEMLSLLPDGIQGIKKVPVKFPDEQFIASNKKTFDAVLVYSVLHTVTIEDNPFNFIDSAVELLAPGGYLLLGDLANRSKRKRFFLSPRGIELHKKYTNRNEAPNVNLQELESGRVDDSLIFAIIQRYRFAGYETYLLPQGEGLPMATRREDILIVKHE